LNETRAGSAPFLSAARAALLVLLPLSACDSFKPASLVEGLRVLAIRAEPAEVGSGEQATLRARIADLRDTGDPIEIEWALCTKRAKVGVEVDPDCFDADSAPYLTPLPTMADGSTLLTMPELTIESFGLPDASGGFYVPVRMRAHSGASHLVAFHRLRWKAGFQQPNGNPTAEGIAYVPTGSDGELPDMGQTVEPQPLVEGVPLELPRGGKLRLRASAVAGSAEGYTTVVGDPRKLMTMDVTEQLRFFWYASAGELDPDVTGEERPDAILDTAELAESLDARDGLVDLWLVVREERGGIDSLHRQIRLR
jgi:hypothetical protein